MKRLNPATGLPFKYGDIREDGYFFNTYQTSMQLRKDGTFYEVWNKKNPNDRSNERYATEEGRSYKLISRAKKRAAEKNIEINISFDKVKKALDNGICELTGIPFDFNPTEKTQYNPYAPSIDRIDSQKGYVDCNIRVVLTAVNSALNQYGEKTMLPILKEMVRAIEKNAKENTVTPVPKRIDSQSAISAKHGTIPSPGFGENYDHTYNHSRTVYWQDTDHSTQASSGDGMGCRGTKVATLVALTRLENNGEPDAEVVRLDFGGRYLLD